MPPNRSNTNYSGREKPLNRSITHYCGREKPPNRTITRYSGRGKRPDRIITRYSGRESPQIEWRGKPPNRSITRYSGRGKPPNRSITHYSGQRKPPHRSITHYSGWGKPPNRKLITPCWVNGRPEQAVYGKHGKFELLNPILNTTYKFVRDLYEEIAEVFPDKYIHLGMDEVYHACWYMESNLNISEFMAEKGFGRDYKTLEQYYVRRVLDIVSSLNSKYVIWQDPIEQGVQAQMDAIVEVWKDSTLGLPGQFQDWQDYMVNITKKGYKTILSACWYLNKIFYGPDWKRFYQCEPLDFNGTAEQHRKVTGGEACMFAEYVDGTNLLSRVWPRASAVAERLWSTRETMNVDEAAFRLDQQRCRLL
ncbi:hypothetical protein KUTeg_021681, partial [Tegillarca granosa]